MEDKYLLVKQKLSKYGQVHLLKFYEELTEEEKENLLEDILEINFEQIEKLYKETRIEEKFKEDVIEHIKYTDKEKLTMEDKEYYNKIGEKIIKNNEYAVVTLAGGQRNKTWTQRTKRNIYSRL
ncbi:MAG: hypothetical protein HFJ41_03605 [Clostridia bacterium]|nr:hypothetical protein [Clostridia bacterium]